MSEFDGKIKRYLPEEELLCQLAEECGELTQAALKLRRVLHGGNPTPVTETEAREKLVEEAADVYCVLGLILDAEQHLQIYEIIQKKKERWKNRLEGSNE